MNFPDIPAERRLTCFACPTQYEGRLQDGRCYYFRYRHGWARLGLGSTHGEAVGDPDATGMAIGDGLDGFMSEPDFESVASVLLLMRGEK